MSEATEIPSFRPSSGWCEDWPFDVDTFLQVEACVTGSAADRAVNTFLNTLMRGLVVDDPGGVRVHYWGGFIVKSAPLVDEGGWQIVLASAGEDAFDSLEGAAEGLVDALRATPGKVRLVWRELPATRVADADL